MSADRKGETDGGIGKADCGNCIRKELVEDSSTLVVMADLNNSW